MFPSISLNPNTNVTGQISWTANPPADTLYTEPQRIFLEYQHFSPTQDKMTLQYGVRMEPLYEFVENSHGWIGVGERSGSNNEWWGTVSISVGHSGIIKDVQVNIAAGSPTLNWLQSFVRTNAEQLLGDSLEQLSTQHRPRPSCIREQLEADNLPADIDALSSKQLKAIYLEPYDSGRIKHTPFVSLQFGSACQVDRYVAGFAVLRYEEGRWCLLLGQREDVLDLPFPGYYTVPVGNAVAIEPQYQSSAQMDRRYNRPIFDALIRRGIIAPSEVDTEAENPIECALRKIEDETGLTYDHADIVGRLDDFVTADGKTRISIFIVVEEQPFGALDNTLGLSNFVSIPLRTILNADPNSVGSDVESVLKAIKQKPTAQLIPEFKKTGLRSLRQITQTAIRPWMYP